MAIMTLTRPMGRQKQNRHEGKPNPSNRKQVIMIAKEKEMRTDGQNNNREIVVSIQSKANSVLKMKKKKKALKGAPSR